MTFFGLCLLASCVVAFPHVVHQGNMSGGNQAHHQTSQHLLGIARHLEDDTCPGNTGLLLAIDAGSSGAKMMVFAKESLLCPAAVNDPCKSGIKIKPPLIELKDFSGFVNAMLGTLERIHLHGECAFDNYIALATAGNRIVLNGDEDAFLGLKNGLMKQVHYQARIAPHTISGTNEAWLEFLAAQNSFEIEENVFADGFISSGGASAQMGIILDDVTLPRWISFMDYLKANTGGLRCTDRAENHLNFACVVDISQNSFSPMEMCDSGTIADKKCVGLVSFLAGCPKREPEGVWHRVGGFKQTFQTFQAVQSNIGSFPLKIADVPSANIREYFNSYLLPLVNFIRGDGMVHEFVKIFKGLRPRTLVKAGTMNSLETLEQLENRASQNADHPFNHLWHVAMTNAFGITAVTIEGKVDWMVSQAVMLGYPEMCMIPGPTCEVSAI